MIQSIGIFILAAACEVNGGYLVWLWIKDSKDILFGIIRFLLLALYGVIATFQDQSFGRVYAAYGGIFIIFSLFWVLLLIILSQIMGYHRRYNSAYWCIINDVCIKIGNYLLPKIFYTNS